MAEFYPYIVGGIWAASALFLAYLLGYRRGRKNEYERGYVAARIKYEIPRDEHGKLVKRQP